MDLDCKWLFLHFVLHYLTDNWIAQLSQLNLVSFIRFFKSIATRLRAIVTSHYSFLYIWKFVLCHHYFRWCIWVAFPKRKWDITSGNYQICYSVSKSFLQVRHFMQKFKATLLNSTQNTLHVHWDMCRLVRDPRFTSSYAFWKRCK